MSMRSVLVVAALAALPTVACNTPQAKTANVVSAPMPGGEKFTGVYQHPVFGELHLVDEGAGRVIGKWQRADKSAWGELTGKTEGNVLRFSWAETKYGFVGPAATRKGRGVFVFERDDKFAYLKGQYGVGEDEVGSKWDNIRLNNRVPNLDSITANLPGTAPVSGGNWE
jgi:hypothetical protein